jgi:hypothetical protein
MIVEVSYLHQARGGFQCRRSASLKEMATFDVYLFVEGMTSKLASSLAKKESHH